MRTALAADGIPVVSELPPGTILPPEILPGRDGWMFWIGRPGNMAAMYGHGPRIAWRLLAWRWLVVRRVRRARSLGVRFLEFVVPDKMSIYGDLVAAPFPAPAGSPGRRLGGLLPKAVRDDAWIDGYGAFRDARDGAPLYYRTDTHWSARGYCLGYALLCRACGIPPAPHVLSGEVQRVRRVLDTGGKCRPAVEEDEEVQHFARRARRAEQNGLVTFREAQATHVVGTSFGSRIVLANDSPDADPRRIVLFGDSHTFHHCGLGAMMAESFREVHLVWSSTIDWAYVGRVRPDVVVHQLAERFLWRVPRDGIDVDAFAAKRLADAERRVAAAPGEAVPAGRDIRV